jgi:hypothetical protein
LPSITTAGTERMPWLPAVRLLTLLLSEDDREKHDAEYDD